MKKTAGAYRFRIHLLAAAMRPALRIAHRLCIPAGELLELVMMEYVRLQLEAGLSFSAIARRTGKSRRKIAYVAKAAKSPSDVLEASTHFRLRRELAAYLAKYRRGKTEEELLERDFGASASQVQSALQALAEQGVCHERESRFFISTDQLTTLSTNAKRHPAPSEAGPAIDAVRNLADAFASAIEHRFLNIPRRLGIARTLQFSLARDRAEERLLSLYADLRDKIVAWDDAIEQSDNRASNGVEVTLFWGCSADADPG